MLFCFTKWWQTKQCTCVGYIILLPNSWKHMPSIAKYTIFNIAILCIVPNWYGKCIFKFCGICLFYVIFSSYVPWGTDINFNVWCTPAFLVLLHIFCLSSYNNCQCNGNYSLQNYGEHVILWSETMSVCLNIKKICLLTRIQEWLFLCFPS